MLNSAAMDALNKELALCIGAFGMHDEYLGHPSVVEKAAKEAERTFQAYTKAKPNREDAYAAARDFIHGKELDSWKRDLIASVLAEPIPAASNGMVLASPKVGKLLAEYEAEVKTGDLWRLTWHGLLCSYFAFNPVGAADVATTGWVSLRELLVRTWPSMDKQSGQSVIPDWVKVLRAEAEILTKNPVNKYAEGFLQGNTDAVDRLRANLGIPPSSWFWHQLVLSAVGIATQRVDTDFQNSIPRLIELIRERPAFRDEAIEKILIRYHACTGAKPNDELREFVIHKDVWRNPKLRASGIAPAWNRVPEAVWRMVMGWVNERALKDFFDILAARNSSDAGRLAFWSRYLQQITWTRLVFGSETMALKYSNQAVRELIARERDDFAELVMNKKADAFLMQIGDYIAVEFSITSNAAYVYGVKALKFDRDARYYNGDTTDLKYGFATGDGLRILHPPGWEQTAADGLRRLGIYPDRVSTARPQAAGYVAARTYQPVNAPREDAGLNIPTFVPKSSELKFSMEELERLVSGFRGARIIDKRSPIHGGRLWVEDPNQSRFLGNQLERWGFVWAQARDAWYLRED